MRFWPWALQAYARAGVSEACLDLQDSHDQSVPYLLWAAWAAGEGRPLEAASLEAGARLAGAWETAAVAPLRQARRGMKAPLAGLPDAERETLRAEVKALELRAEQALMLALEAMTPPSTGIAAALEPALIAAAAAWAVTPPPSALLPLARALA